MTMTPDIEPRLLNSATNTWLAAIEEFEHVSCLSYNVAVLYAKLWYRPSLQRL